MSRVGPGKYERFDAISSEYAPRMYAVQLRNGIVKVARIATVIPGRREYFTGTSFEIVRQLVDQVSRHGKALLAERPPAQSAMARAATAGRSVGTQYPAPLLGHVTAGAPLLLRGAASEASG